MISPALKALLAAIRKHEAPKGYGQIYGGAKGVPKDTDVSKMTLAGVQDLQRRMLNAGSASTACGGYQFIRKTLNATIAQMGLKGSELWDEALQDRMAIHLMEGRGLSKYMAGRITAEDFANNLSMEWASLPVVKSSDSVGSNFYRKTVGRSFYAGDGLNKAFHKPEEILRLVDALKRPQVAVQPDMAMPPPDAPPPRPRGLLAALIDLIMAIFKRK